MLIKASIPQPKTTRPTKPRKSRLFLVERKQKKGIIIFTLESFKDSIKNNTSIQNTFNLIFVSLKYQYLENSNTLKETKTMEIRIQKDTFREEYNKLADRIISLN
jgi:predicted aldo/keto reductase-like oxidoreductase